MSQSTNPLLDVQDLQMHFPIRGGLFGRQTGTVKAVNGVSFAINKGETLGLVGESGCGKTSVGRSLLRIYKPTNGKVLYHGSDQQEPIDLAQLSLYAMKPHWKRLRMVFQDPFLSLNPRMTVFDIVAEPMRIQLGMPASDLSRRVGELLEKVGLRPEYMRRYPHAFSGGQRQRIGIARALALEPELIVADESVSALDVSVRTQILNLMKRLQREEGLTYLFISHDLSVIEYLSDRVAVMYAGKVVELAPNRDLFHKPRHPYTEALLSAIPKPDPSRRSERIILSGDVPNPANAPSGCAFHPRCPYAQPRCAQETPALRDAGGGHKTACHFAETLTLRGVGEPKRN